MMCCHSEFRRWQRSLDEHELSKSPAPILVLAISAHGYASFNYRDRDLNTLSPNEHFLHYDGRAAVTLEILRADAPQIAHAAPTQNPQGANNAATRDSSYADHRIRS